MASGNFWVTNLPPPSVFSCMCGKQPVLDQVHWNNWGDRSNGIDEMLFMLNWKVDSWP